jgi:hypothetical protein
MRSMVQWGALRAGGKKGIFIRSAQLITLSEGSAELIVQAMLVSHGRGMRLTQATSHSALFPFDVRLNASSARKSDQLQFFDKEIRRISSSWRSGKSRRSRRPVPSNRIGRTGGPRGPELLFVGRFVDKIM